MKKMVLVLTLAAFALSGSAFAQDPNYFNNIGLYLTPGGYADPLAIDGTGSCGTVLTENTPFDVFVVLSRLTNPEVWQWEALLTFNNMLFLGDELYGSYPLNAGTRPNEWIVGLYEPMVAVDNAVVVARLEFMINDFYNDIGQPSLGFIEGVYYSSINPEQGPPSYLVAPGGPFEELHPALGDGEVSDGIPQLVINGDCDVVSVEASSWGSLKSLYR